MNHEILEVGTYNELYRESDDRYTIKTEGCTISSLNPFDESIKKYINVPAVGTCYRSNISLLESNQTHIWTVPKNFEYYEINSSKMFTCCYKAFHRPDMIYDIKSKYIDDRIRYDNTCEYFDDIIEATDEFVRVICTYIDKDIYDDFFLFAQKKIVTNSSIINLSNNYNVLIMGVDAVSRMNFHRTMPKTLSYLINKGAIELMGYNKIGDNTYPNVMALLSGIDEKDLKKTCVPNSRSTFDNCPFVWQWFKELGYHTAIGEDTAKLGTFNYLRVGFTGTPTDYYLYTFIHEAEANVGNNRDFNSYLCIGIKYSYRLLLDYVENLVNNLKSDRLFGFFWEVTMSHDYLNFPMLIDDDYEQFLKNMDDSGYMNETILIFLSDHGIRWGGIRKTKQGYLEERLPFVYILMPPSFREKYETAYNNLKSNSRKLTTPFDVHEMLLDLVDMNSITEENILDRMKTSYAAARGISLFLPVPSNRTCKAAGIEYHWCTCNAGRKLKTDHDDVANASEILMNHVNELVRNRPQCAQLSLAEVVQATEMETSNDGITDGWREMILVIRTIPGGAIFEATLRREHRWRVSGSVSRLNLYGDQSRCVNDYHLKLYCFCL